jgi:hypothetical protein
VVILSPCSSAQFVSGRPEGRSSCAGMGKPATYNPIVDAVRRLDDHFVSELGDILAWAVQRGITCHSRFHVYKDNIEWLRAHDRPDKETRIYSQLSREGRLTEMVSTMLDSIELVETIPTIRAHNVDIPKELLQRVFSGPADAFREDSTSNKARNAMFELNMGAMAARSGLHPTLSVTNPDISFEFEGRCVKMECKRILSGSRITERLKEGIKQLEKSVQSADSDVGIVAISLSKLLNPGDRFLVSDSPHEELSQRLRAWLKANEQRFGRMYQPSVMSFLFHLSSAAHVPSVGQTLVNSGTIFPLNTDEQPFLKRLAAALAI